MTEEESPNKQETPIKYQHSKWRKIGVFFSMVGLAVFVVTFGYGYYGLARVNLSLAQSLGEMKNEASLNQNKLEVLQKTTDELKEWAQKSQALTAQQQEIISEWRAVQKGDVEKWHLAEVNYLLKLAQDELQFNSNFAKTKILLQEANQILQTLANPDLAEIKNRLSSNLTELASLPTVDVTKIYLTLTEINNQMDHLVLPSPSSDTNKDELIENKVPSNLPWWKKGLDYSLAVLSKIVIVHHMDSQPLPFMMPEEKVFLYQNLHAQIEDAMWALLHRHADIYQASLNRAKMWIKQYFVQDATTKNVLLALEDLQKINIQPTTMDLSPILQLFDNYFLKINNTSAVKP